MVSHSPLLQDLLKDRLENIKYRETIFTEVGSPDFAQIQYPT